MTLFTGRWFKYSGLLLLYTALTLLLTYPVIGQLTTTVAGFDGRDPFQHVWYQWWLKETLLEPSAWPSRVTQLYYPLGADHPVLILHPYVPLLALPLTLLFGPLVSYNLAFLFSFILSGLTGYLLCRSLCRQLGPALLGGLIFAFYPNRVGHAAAGHLLLTTNYFLPLYALSLLTLLRRPSLRLAVWHGVITALLALAQPTHIGYGLLPVLAAVTLSYAITQREWRRQTRLNRAAGWFAAAMLLAAVIFLPFAWPTVSQQAELTYLTPTNLTDNSTDLLAFILPSPYNPVLAQVGLRPSFSGAIISGFRDLEEQLAYPGLIVVMLTGLALWKRWRAARVWLILTLGCAVLSLGPWLKVGGVAQPIPLPYLGLTWLPFFAWSRAPGRLNETVMLGLAVLAALGADWLLSHWRAAWRGAATAGLALLILTEYLVILPFPTAPGRVPNYYHTLARETQGGVLELPVTGSRRASNYAMYYQTVHERPLAGGYIERDPPGTVELKEFLNQVVSPLPDQMILPAPNEATRRAILADMGLTRVIAQPALMTDRAARKTLTYLPELLGTPVFSDAEITVYPVDSSLRANLPSWSVWPDSENWEIAQEGAAWRLKEQGYLFIYAAAAGRVNLDLALNDTGLTVTFNDAGPVKMSAGGLWGPLPLRQGLNYLRFSTDLPRAVEFRQILIEPVE